MHRALESWVSYLNALWVGIGVENATEVRDAIHRVNGAFHGAQRAPADLVPAWGWFPRQKPLVDVLHIRIGRATGLSEHARRFVSGAHDAPLFGSLGWLVRHAHVQHVLVARGSLQGLLRRGVQAPDEGRHVNGSGAAQSAAERLQTATDGVEERSSGVSRLQLRLERRKSN
eukprot:scaffold748_cov251-Pinguiococcus_pyrenoidosus.AAC.48